MSNVITNILEDNVNKILVNAKDYTFKPFKLTLHTPDLDKIIEYPKYVSIDSDFNKKLTDEVTVEFMIPEGDYREIIYRNLDQLEMTLEIDYGNYKFTNRYKVFVKTDNDDINKTVYDGLGKETLNTTGLRYVKCELVDLNVIMLRTLMVNGVYKNVKLDTLIKALYANKLKTINVNGKPFIFDIMMEPFDNQEKIPHVIIPNNTKLITLPLYLQTTDYGIYNGDINVYVRKVEDRYVIHIYPVYDNTMYNRTSFTKLTIYNTGNIGKGLNDKCVYQEYPDSDYELIVTEVKTDIKGKYKLANTYDSLFIENPTTYLAPDMKYITDDKLMFNTKEAVTREILLDNDTLVHNFLPNKKDINIFKLRSQILRNNNALYRFILPKHYDYFIRPGMGMRYVYMKDGIVHTKYGIVQHTHLMFNYTKETTTLIIDATLEL